MLKLIDVHVFEKFIMNYQHLNTCMYDIMTDKEKHVYQYGENV